MQLQYEIYESLKCLVEGKYPKLLGSGRSYTLQVLLNFSSVGLYVAWHLHIKGTILGGNFRNISREIEKKEPCQIW